MSGGDLFVATMLLFVAILFHTCLETSSIDRLADAVRSARCR